MKKAYFSLVVALFFAMGCNNPSEAINNEQESRVITDQMEMLIKDLLVGVCTPIDCEVKIGDKIEKPFGEGIFGSIGAKFSDYGIGKSIVFYNDGTCKMAYISGLYSDCEIIKDPEAKDHPTSLYDTWQWSYDVGNATITITAEDLKPHTTTTTVKVVSYKDGILMIDGALPNNCIDSYDSFKYKCKIEKANARIEFEETHIFNEDDYPCCRQY